MLQKLSKLAYAAISAFSRIRFLVRLSRIVRFPLIRSLFAADGPTHRLAMIEFFIILLFTLSPIWAGAFVTYSFTTSPGKSYLELLLSNISTGELFLYCTSAVAPVIFAVLHVESGHDLIDRFGLGIISIMVIGFSFVFFGIQRSARDYDEPLLFWISVVAYVLSLFVLYLTGLHRNTTPPDLAALQHENEEKFVHDFPTGN